jgi:hypothetical protein
MSQPDVWRKIRRCAAAAGIAAEIGCHTLRDRDHRLPGQWRRARARAGNGGALEPAHTKPYDRTKERLAQDEVERIGLSFPHHWPACSSWTTGRPLLRAGRHVLAHCRRERNVECG